MQQAPALREDRRFETPAADEPLVRLRFHDAAQIEKMFVPPAECAQLTLRPFAGEATVLQTGALRIVAHSTHESFQVRRRPAPGRICIGYANRANAVTHRGQPCNPRDLIVVANAGAELTYVGAAEFVWVDIDLERLPEIQARALFRAASQGEVLLAGRDAAVEALRRYVAALMLFHLNGLPETEARRRESALVNLVRRALDSSRAKTPSGKRERAFELVRRVEDFMWQNVEDPLTLDRVSEAAGCRARSLTYYFKSLFGVGPMTYLKIRRLENVHRRLKETRCPARIFDVAADFGFWHMGHFGTDYKRMFGTTASRTREVAQTGYGPEARLC
jgi:AraC family ethanolamine operon transcriptional activator